MEIVKTLEDKKLNVELIGRLDTTTAPQLENEVLNELNDVENLVFDFAGLEYISSAGLRALLAAQKTMKGKGTMVIKNVCDEIMEVFDITGFTDILSIENN